MKALPFALVSTALICLLGCGGGSFLHQPTADELVWNQRQYTVNMRWGNKVKVLSFVSREDRPTMIELLKRFEEYEITDYEIGIVDMNPDGISADVLVIYRGYSEKNLYEIEMIEDQEWYWSEEKENWYLRPSVESLSIQK